MFFFCSWEEIRHAAVASVTALLIPRGRVYITRYAAATNQQNEKGEGIIVFCISELDRLSPCPTLLL